MRARRGEGRKGLLSCSLLGCSDSAGRPSRATQHLNNKQPFPPPWLLPPGNRPGTLWRKVKAFSEAVTHVTILVTGAEGQLGAEVVRQAGGAAVGLGHAALDLRDREAMAAALDAHRPGVVV